MPSNLPAWSEFGVFDSCPASQKLPQTDGEFWNVTWFRVVVSGCNHRLIADGRIGKDYERNERRIVIGEGVLVGIGGADQQSRTIESASWEIPMSVGHFVWYHLLVFFFSHALYVYTSGRKNQAYTGSDSS